MRRFLVVILSFLLAGHLAGLSAAVGASGTVSATLPRPLRFSKVLTLDGAEIRKLEVASGDGPVVISGGAVVGAPGASPGGCEVAVLWCGIELGKCRAASDGSFSIPVSGPPDGRVSVLYAPALPDLRSELNVAAFVPGREKGCAASAPQSYYSNYAPECAFDACLYPDAAGTYPTPYGAGMWNAGVSSAASVQRDLGRELELAEVWVWHAGASSQERNSQVFVSRDGVSFTQVAGGTVAAPAADRLESPTFVFRLPEGTAARYVRVVADNGKDWTGLCEVAVLGRVPASEALVAPEWTLPGGPGLSGKPVVLGRYGQSGLPWVSTYCWPDPAASWVWAYRSMPFAPGSWGSRLRAKFSLSDATQALLYVAAGGEATAWLDGVPVLYGRRAERYAGVPLRLAPGDHVLAFEVVSPGPAPGPAGLLVSLRDLAGATLMRSGEGAWEADPVLPAWLLPGSAGDFSGVPAVTPKHSAWTAGPDPDAKWIWTSASASASAPPGRVRFRRPFSLAAPADLTVSVAADNEAYLWVDGVPLLHWTSYSSVGNAVISLPAGEHVLAVEALNGGTSANPAGLLVSVRDASGAVVLRSGDAGWQTSGYVP